MNRNEICEYLGKSAYVYLNDGSYLFGVISHSHNTDEYILESKDFKSMGKIFKIQSEEIDKIFASILYYW